MREPNMSAYTELYVSHIPSYMNERGDVHVEIDAGPHTGRAPGFGVRHGWGRAGVDVRHRGGNRSIDRGATTPHPRERGGDGDRHAGYRPGDGWRQHPRGYGQ